ncbi:hypothetical protein QJS10_CPA01g02814 [Acorus calamus]|uniref:Uncharacterized protein n=1 Tax=Acorus calamus TaxID=4465 RepID=A0AAV9FG16_ACOCL|nr:hypothetical protein QJS10_CPA01g02814 [Acorus calamus]
MNAVRPAAMHLSCIPPGPGFQSVVSSHTKPLQLVLHPMFSDDLSTLSIFCCYASTTSDTLFASQSALSQYHCMVDTVDLFHPCLFLNHSFLVFPLWYNLMKTHQPWLLPSSRRLLQDYAKEAKKIISMGDKISKK